MRGKKIIYKKKIKCGGEERKKHFCKSAIWHTLLLGMVPSMQFLRRARKSQNFFQLGFALKRVTGISSLTRSMHVQNIYKKGSPGP